MADMTVYLKAFVTLLLLVNPMEGMPVFLSATEVADPQLKKKILRLTTVGIITILLASLFFGKAVLQLFGISTGAFQIGGGAVLFLVAVKMTLGPSGAAAGIGGAGGGKLTPAFAIVPLATPLLAGPGAINGAVLCGTRAHTMMNLAVLSAVVVLVGVVTYVILRAGSTLARYIKDTGVSVITRVTGLLIAAVAAEMVIHGISTLFSIHISG